MTLADDVNHCGKCNTVCAGNQAKCVAGTCTKVADCTLVTTMPVWGQPAKGMDFRSWTDSELHIGYATGASSMRPRRLFAPTTPMPKH